MKCSFSVVPKSQSPLPVLVVVLLLLLLHSSFQQLLLLLLHDTNTTATITTSLLLFTGSGFRTSTSTSTSTSTRKSNSNCIICIVSCDAWGRNGHEIVGNIAWKLLSNTTQSTIAQILNITTIAAGKYNNNNNQQQPSHEEEEEKEEEEAEEDEEAEEEIQDDAVTAAVNNMMLRTNSRRHKDGTFSTARNNNNNWNPTDNNNNNRNESLQFHENVSNYSQSTLSSTTTTATTTSSFKSSSSASTCLEYCSPLGLVADWADTIRYSKEYYWTSPLHYIDVRDDLIPTKCPIVVVHDNNNNNNNVTEPFFLHDSKTITTTTITTAATKRRSRSRRLRIADANSCYFNYTRDCPNDACVAGAIVNYTNKLVARNSMLLQQPYESNDTIFDPNHHHPHRAIVKETNKQQQQQHQQQQQQYSLLIRDSLMFVTHFIGDIHQPLHSSRFSDRGGNSISVRFINNDDYDNVEQEEEEEEDEQNNNNEFDENGVDNGNNNKNIYRSMKGYRKKKNKKNYINNNNSTIGRQEKVKIQRNLRNQYPHHHGGLNLHSVWDDSIINKTIYDDYNNSRHAFEEALFHKYNLLTVMNNYKNNVCIKINNNNNNNVNVNTSDEFYYSVPDTTLSCPDGSRYECTIGWGEESLQYSLQYSYRNIDDTEIISGTVLSLEYYKTRLLIVQERLVVAALRLATTLEIVFAKKKNFKKK